VDVVWWFVNDEPMNLGTANLSDDYSVEQAGGFGDRCWGISPSRPGVSMVEAIRRMQDAYPRAHRTMNTGMLRGYLEQIPRELEPRRHPTLPRQRPPKKAA
jgi:hypothetical protein